MYASVVPSGESWRLERSENDPGNCRTGIPSGATSCAPIGGVVTNGTLGAGGVVTEGLPEPGRDASAKAPIAIAAAPATALAPIRRSRDLCTCRSPRGPACGAQPHPVPVERHLEEVCGGIVDPVDRVPAFPELRERLLHQVGSVRTVAGHEVERLEQTSVLLLEEHPEVLRGRGS